MPLTGPQKRYLRGLAHHLDPVVLIGGDRVSEGVVAEVDRALSDHELVKIKLIDAEKEEVLDALAVLCRRTGAEHAQTIGHMLVLWRRNPEAPKVPAMPGETLKRRVAEKPKKKRR